MILYQINDTKVHQIQHFIIWLQTDSFICYSQGVVQVPVLVPRCHRMVVDLAQDQGPKYNAVMAEL